MSLLTDVPVQCNTAFLLAVPITVWSMYSQSQPTILPADLEASQCSGTLPPGNPCQVLDINGSKKTVQIVYMHPPKLEIHEPEVSGTHQDATGNPAMRPFLCEYCLAGFASEFDLGRHKRRHTGERPFLCNLCPMAFSRKDHLVSHMRLHTGEHPYKCTSCPKAFTRMYNLRRHIRFFHR